MISLATSPHNSGRGPRIPVPLHSSSLAPLWSAEGLGSACCSVVFRAHPLPTALAQRSAPHARWCCPWVVTQVTEEESSFSSTLLGSVSGGLQFKLTRARLAREEFMYVCEVRAHGRDR